MFGNLFSKSSSPQKSSDNLRSAKENLRPTPTSPRSPAASPSPGKKKSSIVSAASPIVKAPNPPSPRPRAVHSKSRTSRKPASSTDTHPLNLPPEQRQRRANMVEAREQAMDVDTDADANGLSIGSDASAPSSPISPVAPTSFSRVNGSDDRMEDVEASPMPPIRQNLNPTLRQNATTPTTAGPNPTTTTSSTTSSTTTTTTAASLHQSPTTTQSHQNHNATASSPHPTTPTVHTPTISVPKPSPPTPSPPKPTVDAEACKAAGNKFFKIGDYSKAIAEYSRAIEADPQNATYLANRAAALMSANRYRDALQDAKMADVLQAGNAKVLHRLARIYTSLGQPGEALDTYARIQPPCSAKDREATEQMQLHVQQAEQALRTGTTGSMALHALDLAERGLGSGVDRPRAWKLLRGEAYLKIGNANALGDAQAMAMSILRTNNQDPEALVLRGRALYAQGDNDKALQHFRQALSCDPDYSEAVKYLRMVQRLDRLKEEGNAAFKAGKYDAACTLYGQALAVDPTNRGTNSKILQNRALCYIKVKKYDAAIDDCTRALSLDSGYVKARRTKARAMGESGDWPSALREYQAIAEANPSEPGIGREIRNAELEVKKALRKDYYKILGVEKDCNEQDVKKAYRRLAIVHHPDKNPDNEAAAERFKEIGEAYECLADSERRARYDSGEDLLDPADAFGGGMHHHNPFGGGGMHHSPFGGAGGMQIDPEMLFNMMGNGGGGAGRAGGPSFRFSSGAPPF